MQLSHSDYYVKACNTFSLGTNCLQGDIKKKDFRTFSTICMKAHTQSSVLDSLLVALPLPEIKQQLLSFSLMILFQQSYHICEREHR